MKSLLRAIRRAPKSSGLIAILLAVVTVPAALYAWGPTRPTFTIEKPASYVTFNSITDNPVVGDERNFVAVKDASNKQDGGWKDTITAEPGKEYLVRVYVHNDAAANLNLIAKNTRVMAALGTNTGKKVGLTGYVSADNAKPQRVYDDVNFTSGDNFNLAYVPGSAMLYNNVTGQQGRAVSDAIVDGSGAPIGYEANNGEIPGCFQYASYVTFKVKPQFAEKVNFTTEKSVRKKGDSQWQNSLEARAGDTIEYRILFQNTSGVQLDNVMLDDKLPRDVTYVDGSTRLHLGSDPAKARTMPDSITSKGLNIGSYGKNGLAAVIFDAKIAEKSELECGKNILKNVITTSTDYGDKSDDATVTVQKDCEEPKPVLVEVCEIATGEIITVSKDEADKTTYAAIDSEACTPVVPEKEKSVTPVTELPAELPQTGTSGLAKVIGLVSMTSATAYYVLSRRS